MVTGYEVKMYADIARGANALEQIAEALDPAHDRSVVALERIAEALEGIAAENRARELLKLHGIAERTTTDKEVGK